VCHMCAYICPRVVNPSPGLKGSGEPLFSVSKFVCKFVCQYVSTSVRTR
jgi:hypothetical protein